MRTKIFAAIAGAALVGSIAFAQPAKPATPPAAKPPAPGGPAGQMGPGPGMPPGGPPPMVKLAPPQAGKGPGGKPGNKAMIMRGASLVMFGGCNDCHTPMVFDPAMGGPAPDMSRMLSGHPSDAPDPQGTLGPMDQAIVGPTFTSFKLPFGTVYTANLTPDVDTGTGTWTEDMFLKIMKTGKHLGGNGRPIIPPMPWFGVGTLPDQDLKAIFAYLRSIPPIHNAVPQPKVPEPVLGMLDQMRAKMVDMRAKMMQHK